MITQIPEWLESFAPGTRANYRKSAMIFLDYLSGLNVEEITLATLKRWRRSLPEDLPGLRGHIAAIKSFFKFLYNHGHTTTNLGRCLKVPKQLQIRVERNMRGNNNLFQVDAFILFCNKFWCILRLYNSGQYFQLLIYVIYLGLADGYILCSR